jgi:hypothetical protein
LIPERHFHDAMFDASNSLPHANKRRTVDPKSPHHGRLYSVQGRQISVQLQPIPDWERTSMLAERKLHRLCRMRQNALYTVKVWKASTGCTPR